MPKKEKETEEDKEESSEKDSDQKSEKKDCAETKKEVVTVEIKPGDYVRWGLGRGVDITKSKPWLEKSSFQVRKVDVSSASDIIETKEGGLLKEYREEIRSRTTVNCDVQAGVKPANTPLSVRMDVEYTRSTLSAKYVSGKKIKTRTISFGINFEDVPASLAKTMEAAKRDALSDRKHPPSIGDVKWETLPSVESVAENKIRSTSSADESPKKSDSTDYGTEMLRNGSSATPLEPKHDGATSITQSGSLASNTPPLESAEEVKSKLQQLTMPPEAIFEERLCCWLLNCLQRHHFGGIVGGGGNSVARIQELIRMRGGKLFAPIQDYLDHFVQEFKITHYVSAIELGALEYRELTWKEFVHQAKMSSKASVTAAAYGGVEASTTQKIARAIRNENYQMKKIGVMKDDKVAEEAVIGCSLRPMSGLVKMPFLQHALRESIEKYVKLASTGDGPYWITFGDGIDEPKYITVDHDQDRMLIGTDDLNEAEGFMVKVFDDSTSRNRLEFSITSSFPRRRDKKQVKPQSTSTTTSSTQQSLESPATSESAAVTQHQQPLESEPTSASAAESLDDGSQPTSASAAGTQQPPESQATSASTVGIPQPLEYYLETKYNALRNRSTVHMRKNSQLKNVRLLLKERIEPKISCDTKQWRRGREAYYIRCTHRPRNGYLCVKDNGEGSKPRYEVCVRPTVNYCSHNGKKVYMLFQLKKFVLDIDA